MGNNLSLIHLPAQSGKTRKMTDLIQKWRGVIAHEQMQHNVNIIFTSNTKLLAKQTEKRVIDTVDNVDDDLSDITEKSTDLSDDDLVSTHESEDLNQSIPLECKTYAWIHEPRVKGCKPTTKSVNDLVVDLMKKKYDNIICCTNSTRTRKAFELITSLREMWLLGCLHKRVSIWVDEADCAINIWKMYVNTCRELGDFIEQVIMITATMVPVYKYLGSIHVECRLRVYENTHQPTYHKYTDSIIVQNHHEEPGSRDSTIIEPRLSQNQKCVYYIDRILGSVEIPANSKWFCPGLKNKASHEEVCELLLNRGFNVLILNAQTKEIRYADKRPALQIMDMLNHDLEIAVTLNELYYTTDLCGSPFAVTGNLCVGRGVTFASKRERGEFIFTHAIIPNGYSTGEDAYQLVSRCIGNIKEFTNYYPPVIYIDKGTHDKIIEQENLAVSLASTLYMVNDEETQTVTKETINNLVGREIITHLDEVPQRPKRERKSKDVPTSRPDEPPAYRIYQTQDEVMAASKLLGYKSVHKLRETSTDSAGRYLTSLNSKKEVASLERAVMKVPTAYGTNKGITWRTYLPCYLNVNDVNSLLFVFIIRPDDVKDINKIKRLDETIPSLSYPIGSV